MLASIAYHQCGTAIRFLLQRQRLAEELQTFCTVKYPDVAPTLFRLLPGICRNQALDGERGGGTKAIASKIRSGEPLDPKAPEFAAKGPATVATPPRNWNC